MEQCGEISQVRFGMLDRSKRLLLSKCDAGAGYPSPGGASHRREEHEANSAPSYLKHRGGEDHDGCLRPCRHGNDFFLRTQHRTESSHQSAVWIEADRGI